MIRDDRCGYRRPIPTSLIACPFSRFPDGCWGGGGTSTIFHHFSCQCVSKWDNRRLFLRHSRCLRNVGNHVEELLRSEAINRFDRWATDRADRTRAATHRRPHIPRAARNTLLTREDRVFGIQPNLLAHALVRRVDVAKARCELSIPKTSSAALVAKVKSRSANWNMSSFASLRADRFPGQVCRAASSSCARRLGRHATDRTVVELLSGSTPFVPVMQSADLAAGRNVSADSLLA